MESNFQKLISFFIIQYSMIEAAHLTRQETKELCQQEVQRYIHIPLCTILKTYLFFIIVLILWCFQLYVERKVLLWLFNYDVFWNIFFVYFRLENEVQLLKEKIKAKEECGVWIFELPRWGRRHLLLLFLFVFKYLYVYFSIW